jgi:hypothetical protein
MRCCSTATTHAAWCPVLPVSRRSVSGSWVTLLYAQRRRGDVQSACDAGMCSKSAPMAVSCHASSNRRIEIKSENMN